MLLKYRTVKQKIEDRLTHEIPGLIQITTEKIQEAKYYKGKQNERDSKIKREIINRFLIPSL